MAKEFAELFENKVKPAFSTRGEEPYDADRAKKIAKMDKTEENPDWDSSHPDNFKINVKNKSNTKVNAKAAEGNSKTPSVSQKGTSVVKEDTSDVAAIYSDEIDSLLSEISDLTINEEMMDDRYSCIKEVATQLRNTRDYILSNMNRYEDQSVGGLEPTSTYESFNLDEGFKAGLITFKDGSTYNVTNSDAVYLNQMFSSSASKNSMEKTLMKNSKEFTSILQFAKTLPLGESEELDEVSKEKTDKYLEKAIEDHGHSNFARRMTQHDNESAFKYWSNRERKRKSGISRAIDKLDRVKKEFD